MQNIKNRKIYFILGFLVISVLFIFSSKVNAATLEKTEVNIYGLDEHIADKYKLTMPNDYATSYKIKVDGTTSKPEYEVEDTKILEVSEDGLITLKENSTHYMGSVDVTLKEHKFGSTYVNVKVDGETLRLKVNAIDYMKTYCEDGMNVWIRDNIPENLTQYQKLQIIADHVAHDYTYITGVSDFYGMYLEEKGDCIATADMICYMCNQVGIQAMIRNAIRENLSQVSNHHNASIIIDGEVYVVEASYNQQNRNAKITKMPYGFWAVETAKGYLIRQYDGFDENIVIPSEINGTTVYGIEEDFLAYTTKNIKSITLPDTIKEIGKGAFGYRTTLERINIPDSVTNMGDSIFLGSSIKSENITLGKKYSIKDNVLYTDDGKTLVTILPENNIKNYTVENTVTKIANGAFRGADMKSVTIPSSVTEIGSRAFYERSNLMAVFVPDTVTSIGENAFANCHTDFAIYGTSGSYAQNYANSNNINFVDQGGTYTISKKMEIYENKNLPYNGQEQEAPIELEFAGQTLIKNKDYEITYQTQHINTGTIKYTVTGIGKYAGTYQGTFTIQPTDWDFEFTVPDVDFGNSVTYTITPEVELKYGYVQYQPIDDDINGGWAYLYPSNKLPAGKYRYKAEVNFDGNHNFTTKYATNTVREVPIKSISISGSSSAYAGQREYFKVTYNPNVTSEEQKVTWSSSNQNVATVSKDGLVQFLSAGNVVITATTANGIKATQKVTVKTKVTKLTIQPQDSNLQKDSFSNAYIIYQGNKATFKCVITPTNATNKDITWISDSGYSNIDGNTIATVNSKGVVTGIKAGSSTYIKAVSSDGVSTYIRVTVYPKRFLSDATISYPSSQAYTGKAIKPTITATYNGTKMILNTDYTVSYKNNINAGTASVIITGKGNYTGSVTRTFRIVAKNISKATISNIANKAYTGKAIAQSPTVKDGTVTLKKGTDYTLSYKNNIKKGTASVIITGKGNYTGSVTKTFKILTSISSASVGLNKATFAYTGKACQPTPVVKLGGKTLKKGTDYTVSYTNNIKVGTATVVITGKGNYIGTVKRTFSIEPATTAISKVTAKSKGFTVTWTKKTAQVDGYEIKYSTNGNFKTSLSTTKTISKNTTNTLTINSLKAKTKYFVKVRTYKIVNGKKKYSNWSSAKTIITK